MQTEETVMVKPEVEEVTPNVRQEEHEINVQVIHNLTTKSCNIQSIRPEQFFDSLGTTWLIEISVDEVEQYCEKQPVYSTNLGSEISPIMRYAIKNKDIEITGWDEEFEYLDTCNA